MELWKKKKKYSTVELEEEMYIYTGQDRLIMSKKSKDSYLLLYRVHPLLVTHSFLLE